MRQSPYPEPAHVFNDRLETIEEEGQDGCLKNLLPALIVGGLSSLFADSGRKRISPQVDSPLENLETNSHSKIMIRKSI